MPASFWIAPSLLALVLLWLTIGALGEGGEVDRELLALLYAGDRPLLAWGALWVTRLGDGGLLVLLTLVGTLLLILRGRRRAALVLLAGTLLGRAAIELQKLEIARLRPDSDPPLVVVHSLSFPSGHAGNSMLVYLSLALLLVERPARSRRWWAAAAVLLSLAIGLSRVVLGVHWPSDVVAGWAFGLLAAILLNRLAAPEKPYRSGI